MPAKKTAKKTARPRTNRIGGSRKRSRARGKPFTGKDDPRNGKGKKGRSGRIPNELKRECEEAIFSFVLPKLINYVKAPKKTASDAGWRWAVDTLLDRGFGKVPQPITGDDEGDPIGVRLEREEALRRGILERLASIAGRQK